MEIKRETLLENLQMLKAGLSQREFIEQSTCICFLDGEAMTFNDEVACRIPVGLPLRGAVRGALLLELLEKLEDEVLWIEENEKGEFEFRGKGKRFGLLKDAEIFLPVEKVQKPEKWKTLPPEFLTGIELVKNCVSSDESRFVLTCIHLTPAFIESCDNHQLLRYPVELPLPRPILVRGSSLSHVVPLGMDSISITSTWIHFRNPKGLVLSCRRYDEDYPSLEKWLHFEGHPISIPRGLEGAGNRATVMAEDKSGDPLVEISISPGVLRIKGEGLGGWYREVKKVSYEGPPVRFLIAPDLLLHISRNYREAQIAPDRLMVQGGEEGWTYLTVLIRKQETNTNESDKKE